MATGRARSTQPGRRPARWALVIAVLLVETSACRRASGSTQAAPSPTPTTSSSVAASAAAVTGAAPPTTVAPTTTTTVAPLVVTRTVLADTAAPGTRRRSASEAVVGPGEHRVLVAGAEAATRGEAAHAKVFDLTRDARDFVAVPLDERGATASWATAIAQHGGSLVVAGQTEHGGEGRAAVWASDDAATRWSAVDAPWADRPSEVVAATFVGGAPLLAGRLASDGGVVLAVARRSGGSWSTTDVTTVRSATVRGVAAADASVLLTATVTPVGTTSAAAWRSTDGGATFAAEALPGDYSSISAPAVDGDGFVAVASRADGAGLELLRRSTEAWTAVPVEVTTQDGVVSRLTRCSPRNVAVRDGRYLFGARDVLAAVADVDAAGNGTSRRAANMPGPIVLLEEPWVIASATELIAVTNRAAGFGTYSVTDDQYGWSGADVYSAATEPGAAPTGVGLHPSAGGVLADASSRPHVSSAGVGRVRWDSAHTWSRGVAASSTSPSSSWGAVVDGAVPESAFGLASDGSVDRASELMPDPADAANASTIDGTGVRTRAPDGTWGEPVLVLSGKGGDVGNALAPTPLGWMMAGVHHERLAEGSDSQHPALAIEGADGWTEVPVDVAGDAYLSSIVSAPDSPTVVLGRERRERGWSPLVVSPRADGTWGPADLGDATGLSVSDGVADAGRVTLLGLDASGPTMFDSNDGRTFTRRALSLPEGAAAFPQQLVRTGHGLVLVGVVWRAGVSSLAVWTSGDGGVAWQRRALADGDATLELDVDDALVVGGDRLVVGGRLRRQSVVWEVAGI